MIGEEKDFINKSRRGENEKKVIGKFKEQNKERASKGLNPIYIKKSNIFQFKLVQEK